MGRFEPSGDPRDAVERGFYVPRPGRSLAEQLASRFELKPNASHLLMGGVGSGKTTQLLVARDRLAVAGDVAAVYVDVSLRVEPNLVTSADLLAVVGLALIEEIEGRGISAEEIEGQDISADLDSWRGVFADHLAGMMAIPDPFELFGNQLARLLKDFTTERPHPVLLLDSLDRMTDLERFADIVENAVTKLRALRIGVILIGPLTALYGIRRTALDRFDRTWHLPTVDVQDDAEGHAFLLRVLRARDAFGLITDAAAERLASLSGGVLRDLIALTQAAGEEAYVDGAEHVELQHVEVAAELFGRKHLVAIDSQELEVLQRVRAKGTFVQTSEKDLALLATRRVLEYTNGHARFAVHPTIAPLLAQLAGEP